MLKTVLANAKGGMVGEKVGEGDLSFESWETDAWRDPKCGVETDKPK